VELGASAVLDLYELPLPSARVRPLFLTELMALPRSLWRPIIVVIDEAHKFAPERGSGESQSTEAVIALCTQGRKRGFCLVLATQRISKLHKDAAAELLNKMIGRTGLDVDVKRAGDELGFDKDERRRSSRSSLAVLRLRPGDLPNEVTIVRPGE
jgi:DNA helicase HerA-like ATPase